MSSIIKRASISFADGGVDVAEKSNSIPSRVSFLKNDAVEENHVIGAPINIKIFDQSGDDVTPKPLNIQKRKVKEVQRSTSDQESSKYGRKSSVDSHEESMLSDLPPGANGFLSFIIDAPFQRNVFGVSLSLKPMDPMECLIDSVPSMQEGFKSEGVEMTERGTNKEERADVMVNVLLSEVETRSLIELPSIVVGKDPTEVEEVNKMNDKYKQLLQSKEGSDAYVEKSIATFDEDSKSKSTQTPFVGTKDATWNASHYDSTLTKESSSRCQEAEGVTPSQVVCNNKPLSFEEISMLESFAFSLMVMERMVQLKAKQSELAVYRNLPVIHSRPPSPTSPTPATPPQQEARAPNKTRPPITPPTKKVRRVHDEDRTKVDRDVPKPSLDLLWSFAGSVLGSRGVECFGWNAVDSDLLVVGYGRTDEVRRADGEVPAGRGRHGTRAGVRTGVKKGRRESSKDDVDGLGGLVCCWSIKNPDHPERIYRTDGAVTSVAFCYFPGNLLAVGLENGVINIYNVSSKSNLPIISSFSNPNKHQGPVWSLKWKHGDPSGGRHASLVSISSDGKVLRWTLREEFECTEMLEMRRILSMEDSTTTITSTTTTSGVEASFISKLVGGMCLSFSPFDENIYLVGTEHGDIHKCDCSYTDQFLHSYKGHLGQVYEVLWSPFNPQVFLSCGSDWTVRLWVQNQKTPVLTMFSFQKSVRSVCWSPRCSTMFAVLDSDQVQVWNLAVDLLEPILKYSPRGPGLTRVLFAVNSNCLLIGQKDGQVLVFKLTGISYGKVDQEEALNVVIDSCEVMLNKQKR